MFFGQLLKILFFGIIIYTLFSLIRFLIRIGRASRTVHSGEEKKARQNIREEGPRMRMRNSRNETIELDKDQYKVE